LKRKVLKITLILILLIGLLGLFEAFKPGLSDFLSESHKVDGNILVIDGWLRITEVEMIREEIRNQKHDLIIIPGMQSSDLEFCIVPMNGFLIFYPRFHTLVNEADDNHIIEITTRSKMGGIYRCHFNFYVNDSLVADFVSNEHPGRSSLKWHGSLRNIDSLTVQFTNDMFDENGDRDLYVKEIIIDDTLIISYQYNSVIDFGLIGGSDRIFNDYDSHPQIIRNKLFTFGVDSSKVRAITVKKTSFNRTLASALAVRNWIKSSGKSVKGINVVSMGIHSRRTLLTYKRVFNKTDNIGIISLPERDEGVSGKNSVFRIFVEMADYLYYNIILIPYMWSS